ncbi:MAG: SDR family oxidoreductase, partial [Candidatus Hodarchaeota archaeon]
IGKQVALSLAWLGATIIIAEIADTGTEIEMLIKAQGGNALFIRTDISDEQSMQQLADQVHRIYGKVDILVNNAVATAFGSMLELPLEVWDKIYRVNIRAVVLGTKLFLPGMLERKEGVIVTMSSSEGMPYASPYFASKCAVQSLGLSLAAELGEETGVSVYVFGPGMVDTPGGQEGFRELAKRYNINYEEFISQKVNPGYDGLMPAEDCGAGFAYTIAHAKNYHGQITGPFKPLMDAGITKTATITQHSSSKTVPKNGTPNADISISKLDELGKELQSILQSVSKEINEQNRFVKGWMKRYIQKKTTISIDEWIQFLTEWRPKWSALAQTMSENRDVSLLPIHSQLPEIISLLEKLSKYFNYLQEDAQGYFKDPKKLKEALDELNYRKNVTNSTINTLRIAIS